MVPKVELRQRDVWVDGAAVLQPGEAQFLGGVAEALVVYLAALLVHREEVEVHRAGDVVVEAGRVSANEGNGMISFYFSKTWHVQAEPLATRPKHQYNQIVNITLSSGFLITHP